MFPKVALLASVFAAFSALSLASPVARDTIGNPYDGSRRILNNFNFWQEVGASPGIDSFPLAAELGVQVATFQWVDATAKLAVLAQTLLSAANTNELAQIVLYNLPDRNCATVAQTGEFSYASGGAASYETFIDSVVASFTAHPTAHAVIILEPNSLAAVAGNPSVSACSGTVGANYQSSLIYAVEQLSAIPNVYLYIDAGNAAIVSSSTERTALATALDAVYSGASSPDAVRGLATNVAGYNALTATTADPAFGTNPVYDEALYASALSALVALPAHFVVDQSRAGQAGVRAGLGDWCNVKDAGLGMRPTAATGNALFDAVVWAKNPGESDGTSDAAAADYDPVCAQTDAWTPSPAYDAWNYQYFESLLTNTNPPF